MKSMASDSFVDLLIANFKHNLSTHTEIYAAHYNKNDNTQYAANVNN